MSISLSAAQMAELAAVLARPRLQSYLDGEEATAIVDNTDTRAVILDDPAGGGSRPRPQGQPYSPLGLPPAWI